MSKIRFISLSRRLLVILLLSSTFFELILLIGYLTALEPHSNEKLKAYQKCLDDPSHANRAEFEFETKKAQKFLKYEKTAFVIIGCVNLSAIVYLGFMLFLHGDRETKPESKDENRFLETDEE